jgi:ABC-type branched-subunit amino acid transport system ATPase component
MELPDSKVFCLMGRNGVGKTTTLKTVVGLYKASSGTIRLDGKDISRMPAEARARAGIGYVPQGRWIFHDC